MDVPQSPGGAGAAAAAGAAAQVTDPVGARVQKLFSEFLEESGDDGYLARARELVKPEHNTMEVSLKDLEVYNASLAALIVSDYYR